MSGSPTKGLSASGTPQTKVLVQGLPQQQMPQQFNVNIQQLINEYKQKLNAAIKKEDKDLIMKNIVAY